MSPEKPTEKPTEQPSEQPTKNQAVANCSKIVEAGYQGGIL